MTLQEFHDLSRFLTGFDSLPNTECESYRQRLLADPLYQQHLQPIIDLNKTHGPDTLTKLSPPQLACCRGIVFLWYTSELIPFNNTNQPDFRKARTSDTKTGSETEYYNSLLWKVIRAHPPGLSGGYYGHWKYEPEN